MEIEVRQTNEFRHWLQRLRDGRARARIVSRIRRIEAGNPATFVRLAVHFGR
jgi:putative component of toxin-antitoxin plasmid stabilization module